MPRILIVEDEEIIRSAVRKLLQHAGYEVADAGSVEEAEDNHDPGEFDLIISDLRLPGAAGTELIRRAPDTPVLIMTSYASLRSAVDSMKMGAVEYIAKPFDHDEMLEAVEGILARKPPISSSNTQSSSNQADAAAPDSDPASIMFGHCDAMQKVFTLIRKVAPTETTVLIQGESGTGKELAARALHLMSPRAARPLISVNCAAIPESLIESELFGHVDVRMIAATHRNLKAMTRPGGFREDLFYRLNVMQVRIPPLRERQSDILGLAQRFLQRQGEKMNKPGLNLTPEAMRALERHRWPGNVRELENAIERATILCDNDLITPSLLDLDGEGGDVSIPETLVDGNNEQAPSREAEATSDLSLEDYFQHFVLENQDRMSETELAQKLGISRKSLWERRQRLGIPRKKSSGN